MTEVFWDMEAKVNLFLRKILSQRSSSGDSDSGSGGDGESSGLSKEKIIGIVAGIAVVAIILYLFVIKKRVNLFSKLTRKLKGGKRRRRRRSRN